MIYFLQEHKKDGLIKIGYVKTNVEKRVSILQTGNPTRLVTLKIIEGTARDEGRLHRRFRRARELIVGRGSDRITFRGEWFRPVPELLEFVNNLPTDPTPRVPCSPLPAESIL